MLRKILTCVLLISIISQEIGMLTYAESNKNNIEINKTERLQSEFKEEQKDNKEAVQEVQSELANYYINRWLNSGPSWMQRIQFGGDFGFGSKSSAFRLSTTQPIKEKKEESAVYWQAMYNSTNSTLNAGIGYRKLVNNKTAMAGINAFYDRQFRVMGQPGTIGSEEQMNMGGYSRIGLGAEYFSGDIETRINSYLGLSKDLYLGTNNYIADKPVEYYGRVMNGIDLSLNTNLSKVNMPWLKVGIEGYKYGANKEEKGVKNRDDQGIEGQVKIQVTPQLMVTGGYDFIKNSGNLGFSMNLFAAPQPAMLWGVKEQRKENKAQYNMLQPVQRNNTIKVEKYTAIPKIKKDVEIKIRDRYGNKIEGLNIILNKKLEEGYYSPRSYIVQTNFEGTALFKNIVKGEYRVDINDNSEIYNNEEGICTIEIDSAGKIKVIQENKKLKIEDKTYLIEPRKKIEEKFLVTDTKGIAIQQAKVTCIAISRYGKERVYNCETDEKGEAKIEDFPTVGNIEVKVKKEGYFERRENIKIEDKNNKKEHHIIVQKMKTGYLSVTILCSVDKKLFPMQVEKVQLISEDKNGDRNVKYEQSKAEGNKKNTYVFEEIDLGKYEIRVIKDKYSQVQGKVIEIKEGDENQAQYITIFLSDACGDIEVITEDNNGNKIVTDRAYVVSVNESKKQGGLKREGEIKDNKVLYKDVVYGKYKLDIQKSGYKLQTVKRQGEKATSINDTLIVSERDNKYKAVMEKVYGNILVSVYQKINDKEKIDLIPDMIKIINKKDNKVYELNIRNNKYKTIKLPVGEYKVKVYKKGYENVEKDVDLKESKEEQTETVELFMHTIKGETGTIKIRIENKQGEEIIADKIELIKGKKIYNIDPLTQYETNIESGKYLLKAEKQGWRTENKEIQIENGKKKVVNLIFEQVDGYIKIETTYKQNSITVDEIEIENKETGRKEIIESPKENNLVIKKALGKYIIRITKNGFKIKEEQIEVKNDNTVEYPAYMKVELEKEKNWRRLVKIEIKAKDEDNNDLEITKVELKNDFNTISKEQALAKKITVFNVPVGKYKLYVENKNYEQKKRILMKYRRK